MLIPKALTIAGSDSGGGAGIQADLKTFSAYRVFGMSVITAVTAQNSVGVQGVERPAAGLRGRDSSARSSRTSAPTRRNAGCCRRRPSSRQWPRRSTSIPSRSWSLIRSWSPSPAMRSCVPMPAGPSSRGILPLALVVTPNLPEAGVLADMRVETRADMEEAARRIRALGPRYVLVKGGHLKGEAARSALERARVHRVRRPRAWSRPTRTAPGARSPPRSRPA